VPEKKRNRQHDIWCLITNAWANYVAIVSSAITNIFNLCKHWTDTIQPSVFCVQWISVYSYLSLVFCYCSSVLFDFHLLCSVFVRFALFDYSVFNYLFMQCYFLSWYQNCIPGISIPISTTIRQVNKHNTSGSDIFCLSIGSENLLPSQTLVGYPEPISPNRVGGGRDIYSVA
jgi:hypothetical protein